MTIVSRLSPLLRSSAQLTLTVLLSSFAAIGFGQSVVMEIPSGNCGSPAMRSVTDTKWHYKWQKDLLLVVSGALSEGGSTRVKPGSARITQRGNLIIIVYENYELERELDENGQQELPPLCSWRIPVTFSIRGLDDDQYYLIVGLEMDGRFRVWGSLLIEEPSE